MEENDDLNPIPKPDSFLALNTVAEKLFNTLRKWFDVQPNVTIDLTEIDSAITELGESEMIAAPLPVEVDRLGLLPLFLHLCIGWLSHVLSGYAGG